MYVQCIQTGNLPKIIGLYLHNDYEIKKLFHDHESNFNGQIYIQNTIFVNLDLEPGNQSKSRDYELRINYSKNFEQLDELPSFNNTDASICSSYLQFQEVLTKERQETGEQIYGGRKSKKSLFETLSNTWGLPANSKRSAVLVSIQFKEFFHRYVESLPKNLNLPRGENMVIFLLKFDTFSKIFLTKLKDNAIRKIIEQPLFPRIVSCTYSKDIKFLNVFKKSEIFRRYLINKYNVNND